MNQSKRLIAVVAMLAAIAIMGCQGNNDPRPPTPPPAPQPERGVTLDAPATHFFITAQVGYEAVTPFTVTKIGTLA